MPRRLDLDRLAQGMPAITVAYGKSLAESGAVCLENQGHREGVAMAVQFDEQAHAFVLDWTPTTKQAKMCYADPQVAVEQGACAISLLLVRELTG